MSLVTTLEHQRRADRRSRARAALCRDPTPVEIEIWFEDEARMAQVLNAILNQHRRDPGIAYESASRAFGIR
jgi:hypothetical protein